MASDDVRRVDTQTNELRDLRPIAEFIIGHTLRKISGRKSGSFFYTLHTASNTVRCRGLAPKCIYIVRARRVRSGDGPNRRCLPLSGRAQSAYCVAKETMFCGAVIRLLINACSHEVLVGS